MKSSEFGTKPATQKHSDLRIAAFAGNSFLGKCLRFLGPLLDRLTGIYGIRRFYENNHLEGLPKREFLKQTVANLNIRSYGINDLLDKVPQSGPVVIVANHPLSGAEVLLIADALADHRSDLKIMGNVGLRLIKELHDYFIFTNPLIGANIGNSSSIRDCIKHVQKNGLLLIFPAGSVSFYRSDKKRVTDGEWNRLPGKIAQLANATVIPMFVTGKNTSLFYNFGRIYYRFRLLMLPHTILGHGGKNIGLIAGTALSPDFINKFSNTKAFTDFLRVQTYLNNPEYSQPWPAGEEKIYNPLISPSDKDLIAKEINNLPAEQHLLDYKIFSVYCGYRAQLEQTVREITRLREKTFRVFNEGSGEGFDGDHFDATYMHLFIFNHADKTIIGAYRIGHSEILQKDKGLAGIYLSNMFDFREEFPNRSQACLELGRSFIVPEYQKNYSSLLLLLKGIGVYICRNPKYRVLYGTVSLSKLYNPCSIHLINELIVQRSSAVQPKHEFTHPMNPELKDYLDKNALDDKFLTQMIQGLETDGKGLPPLLKAYRNLGAKFHCIGIDKSFNDTPGLLLSVDVPNAPIKYLETYLVGDLQAYLNY